MKYKDTDLAKKAAFYVGFGELLANPETTLSKLATYCHKNGYAIDVAVFAAPEEAE